MPRARTMRQLLSTLLLILAIPLANADEWRVNRPLKGTFAEARDAVVMAIENRGMVISQVSHIGDMLERTGADIGASRKLFTQAEIIEFCSASLSRQTMEVDPHNIVLCPFAISVYTLPEQPETVWLGYRKPPGAAAAIIDKLFSGIVEEVAGQL